MTNTIKIVVISVLAAAMADAAGPCPVKLVSGTAERDGIAITIRNVGKLPVRRLELNCEVLRGRLGETRRELSCREDNALFYPGSEYTLRYPYPTGRPGTVQVSLKSVTTSDGTFWRPKKNEKCRSLTIAPATATKNGR